MIIILFHKFINFFIETEFCDVPLGMQNGIIPNSRITASSTWDNYHSAALARLWLKRNDPLKGAWSAGHNNGYQWIQVDLGRMIRVTGVATQGREDYDQWVVSYVITYSLDGKTFAQYKNSNVFPGNNDQNTVVKNALRPTIIASYIRIHPYSWHKHISMRLELYGCNEGKYRCSLISYFFRLLHHEPNPI